MYILDGQKEKYSNWMRFVNTARNSSEQNLKAIHLDEKIFYETCKDIKNGEELLVWYGKEYAKELGIYGLREEGTFILLIKFLPDLRC